MPLTSASCTLFSCRTLKSAKPAAVSNRRSIVEVSLGHSWLAFERAVVHCLALKLTKLLLTAAVSEKWPGLIQATPVSCNTVL
jgi:hypothetical protein